MSTAALPHTPRALSQAMQDYLTAQRAGKPSANTVKAHRADLAGVSVLLAGALDVQADELSTADLTGANLRMAFAQFADTHAKTSTNRAWSTWNRLCDFLVQDDQITGNPMAAVPKPRPARAAPHAFTETDTAHLLATVHAGNVPGRNPWPERDYAILATLAVTGLRASELLGLSMGDVEGKTGQRQIAVHAGKGDKYRAVPLDPGLEPVLTEYLTSRWARTTTTFRAPPPSNPWKAPGHEPLWVDHHGTALTIGKLEYLVRQAYRAAGINSHRPAGALIHALRHTFATRLVENGVSSVEVMHLLGHADLKTTQRYVATRPDHLRTAIAANPTLKHSRQA